MVLRLDKGMSRILNGVGVPGVILLVVVLGLIILFVVLFIRKLLTNSNEKNKSQVNMEKRLSNIEDKMDLIIKINKDNE